MTIVTGSRRDRSAAPGAIRQGLRLFADGEACQTVKTASRSSAEGEMVMYKRIILAVDLAEPTPAPKGLTQAVELANVGGGDLRLVNVQPVIPATFMEYVPVDFDVEQANRAKIRSMLFLPASFCLPSAKAPRRARAGSITNSYRKPRNGAPTSSSLVRIVRSCRTISSARTPRRSCAMRNVRCWWSGNDAARRSQRFGRQTASARIAASTPSGVSGNIRC